MSTPWDIICKAEANEPPSLWSAFDLSILFIQLLRDDPKRRPQFFNLNFFIEQLHSIEDSEELIESFKDFQKKDVKNLKKFEDYLIKILHISRFLEKNKNIDNKNLHFFEKVNSSNLENLDKKLIEYKETVSGLFGSFLKGGKISSISDDIGNLFGIKKKLNFKYDLKQVLATAKIFNDLEYECTKATPKFNFNEIIIINWILYIR